MDMIIVINYVFHSLFAFLVSIRATRLIILRLTDPNFHQAFWEVHIERITEVAPLDDLYLNRSPKEHIKRFPAPLVSSDPSIRRLSTVRREKLGESFLSCTTHRCVID